MLDFRKALFAIAVAGLGLVGTASAQITCANATNVTGASQGVHAEGATEQLSPVVIEGNATSGTGSCAGFVDTTSVSVNITANATITNAALSGGGVDAVGIISQTTSGGATSITEAKSSSYNSSSNTLTFNFTTAVGNTVNYIEILNVRINASTLPAGTTFNVTATGSGTGSLSITTGTPTIALAISQKSLGTTSFAAYNNVALCNIAGANNLNAVGNVNIASGFAGALETDGQAFAKEQNTCAAPNTVCGGVTGGTAGLTGNPILSTNTIGTRLAVTFANLVGGVTYYLPVSVTSGSLILDLVPSATTPCGDTSGVCNGAISGSPVGSGSSFNSQSGATAATGLYAFTPTNGTFTAYYAVAQTASSAGGAAAVDSTVSLASPSYPFAAPENGGSTGAFNTITLFEVTPSPATALTPPNGAATAQVVLVGNVSPLYDEFVAPATIPTATAMLSVTAVGGELTPCNTTLLFPYLVSMLSQNGYDSGIAITNAGVASALPPGASVATSASGTCMVTFWGGTSQNVFGSAAGTPITPFTIGPVTVSNQQPTVFVLSQILPSAVGGNFVGWAAANCTFSEGHGFAQISNASSGFSEGYLADITSLVQSNGSGYLVTTPLQ